MNIEKANAIPMTKILSILGFNPVKKMPDEWIYESIFQKKGNGFHVNLFDNTWYDTNKDKSGRTVDFVCAWLDFSLVRSDIHSAVRWLNNMTHVSTKELSTDFDSNEDVFIIEERLDIRKRSVVDYLQTRNIPLSIARRYLQQAKVSNTKTGEPHFVLCMKNEDGGFNVQNDEVKGIVLPNAVSFVRGRNYPPTEVNLFENMLDFLSVSEKQNGIISGDAIILHSSSNIFNAFTYIKNYMPYETVIDWFGASEESRVIKRELRAFVKQQPHLQLIQATL